MLIHHDLCVDGSPVHCLKARGLHVEISGQSVSVFAQVTATSSGLIGQMQDLSFQRRKYFSLSEIVELPLQA